jgi:hypothetical protein
MLIPQIQKFCAFISGNSQNGVKKEILGSSGSFQVNFLTSPSSITLIFADLLSSSKYDN